MITIKKNPETVGKLQVGTSSSTPADGELFVGGQLKIEKDGLALKIDGSANTAKGILLRNTGNQHGYLQTDGSMKLIAEDAGKSISFYTANDGSGTARLTIDSSGNIQSSDSASKKPSLTLENTTDDVNSSELVFNKNRAGSASANDIIGSVRFKGKTTGGDEEYATIYAQATDVTDGDEDCKMFFRTRAGGGFAARLTIQSDGAINISNLSASSDVQTDGSKNLITSSDKRLKNDIGELTAGLDIIGNLKPHYFSWKSDETNNQQLGFYAQDVYEFLPEAAPREQKQNLVTPEVEAQPATYWQEGDELPEGVAVGDEKTPAVEAVDAVYEPATNEDGTPDYNWGFNGRPIIAALVAAVKELKAKVEVLEGA